jgi:hypothetical protein
LAKAPKKLILWVANSVLWRITIIWKANLINLFVSSVLFFSGTIHRTFRKNTRVFTGFCDRLLKRPFLTLSRSFDERCQQWVVKDKDHLKANIINLFVSSFFLVPFTEIFGRTVYIYMCVCVCMCVWVCVWVCVCVWRG